MKIAVCGSGMGPSPEIVEKAQAIGKIIAKKNALLLTGAGTGYPYEACKAAFTAGGTTVGISPAKNKNDHVSYYKFPTEVFSDLEYTGMGIPARNFPLVQEADAIIVIGGQIGTLNEFTIAYALQKPIGILENSGGITPLLDQLAHICDKNSERANVVFSDEPQRLVDLVFYKLDK